VLTSTKQETEPQWAAAAYQRLRWSFRVRVDTALDREDPWVTDTTSKDDPTHDLQRRNSMWTWSPASVTGRSTAGRVLSCNTQLSACLTTKYDTIMALKILIFKIFSNTDD